MISSEQAAYLAGFVDGEGCITFTRRKHGFYPVIQIGNTHAGVLRLLRDIWGGRVHARTPNTEKWAAQYSLVLFGPRAIEVLRKIRPYLVIKAEQADMVLLWRELRPKGKPLSQEQKDSLVFLDDEMRRLNKRGPKAVG